MRRRTRGEEDKHFVEDGDGGSASTPTTGSNDDSVESGYVRHEDLPIAEERQRSSSSSSEEHRRRHREQPHIARELFLFLKRRSWKKKLLTLVVILSVTPVILDVFVFRSGHLRSCMSSYLTWIGEHTILGPFSYVAVLVLTSLIFIPPSILIFASGFTFTSLYGRAGIPYALVTSYVGSTIGGAIGFVRARYMTRDLVEVLMRRYPMIRAVDAAIVRNSLRVMILMRLNCLIPFGVLNYVFGITGVPWDAFVLGIVGALPWQLFLICLGASSATYVDTRRGEDEEEERMRLVLTTMGVVFGFIGLAITWKFAKKELQKEVDPTESLSVEDADLHVADYFQIWVGNDQTVCDDGIEARVDTIKVGNYQSRLTWNEIILDDFS
ncbi:hypothetical protein ACHAW5_005052 [Stephanodiscus triporus]|uniref:VTT domain-containing protein n=1 Tax=Stephanodiscus triporus TaxID=2934178 RepID=A0ABD3NIP7_9STRA